MHDTLQMAFSICYQVVITDTETAIQ